MGINLVYTSLMLLLRASLVAQMVKATEDVGSILGLDDSLEKEMATHSNILV